MHARRWCRRLQSRKTNGFRPNDQWMQQHTHLARLRGGAALPLTLLAQGTGTATTDTGRIDDAQAPIGFSALLMRTKLLASGTPQRPIWLERKVLTREAVRFPGQAHLRGSIAGGRSCVRWDRRDGSSKLGGAQRSWLKLMAQLQAHVPDPLTDDLPGFLSSRCMTAPAIRVLFLVFISQHRFKSATMQVECHDIGGGEPILRQMGEKEFVDHALAGVTDAALFLGSQVGSHHDAAAVALWPHRDTGAVVERAHQGAFRATEVGIGGQVEPRLYGWVIQHRVVFASYHEEEAIQICHDG